MHGQLASSSCFSFRRSVTSADRQTLQQLAQYDQHITHTHYECPVYIWISQAWVRNPDSLKLQPRFVVYMEYRDRERRCLYQEIRFESLQDTLFFIHNKADTYPLETICAKATRSYPIKQAH